MNLTAKLIVLLALCLPLTAPAAPVQAEHIEAELIAENLSLKADGWQNWVALRLRPEPGWHVYWQNPGDSGLPTKLNWALPAGVEAGPIEWPYPHRESLGELTNYGYSAETLHLVPMILAGNAAGAGTLTLKAQAKWLVCADVCIPGEAELELTLPVAGTTPQPSPDWAEAFAKARAELPLAAPDWESQFAITSDELSLSVGGAKFEGVGEVEFFPIANDLVAHAAPQRVEIDAANGLHLSQKLSPYFVEAPQTVEGVLVLHGADRVRAFQIRAQPGEVAPVAAAATATAAAPEQADPGLLLMLAFALLGGVILNLMPCVFPVLSLKALSVMQARDKSAAEQRGHALAYTAGVIGSFLLVAGALLALRAGGAALGWGFQLQSPVFVAILAYLMFALALSLSGVVEFGAGWMGAGQNLAAKGGYAGSFFTGVLACIVASPCTAPFMGTALGFALTQPAYVSLLVFFALGLGLALPFLLVGFFPRLAAFLPRPGAWMETFKQVMAFPLYLTVVWLLWVLGGLSSREGMALAAIGLVLLAFALWLRGRRRGGVFALLLQLAALAGAIGLLAHPLLRTPSPIGADQTAAGWEPWSEARMAALQAEGRSVFVDFTADWCLTCKVNERVALHSDKVERAFADNNVALLVGDWTRSDPAITALLQRYGRSGVPLYLVSVRGGEPKVLPQVLTPDIVVQALD